MKDNSNFEQQHDINSGNDMEKCTFEIETSPLIVNEHLNHFQHHSHTEENYKSQDLPQRNNIYQSIKLNKHYDKNIVDNTSSYVDNNAFLYHKHFKLNDDNNALKYLNASSQHNNNLINDITSMNKINQKLSENIIKRIHDENELIKRNYNSLGTFHQRNINNNNNNTPIAFINSNNFNGQVIPQQQQQQQYEQLNQNTYEIQNKEYDDTNSIRHASNDNSTIHSNQYNITEEATNGTTQIDNNSKRHYQLTQRMFNSKDDFIEFLKEENSNLKYTNFVYKQLLDSLFFFINSLSHKYSFNKVIYPISYYTEHLDDLTKSLLDLDRCIANSIDIAITNNQHHEFIKHLQIVNETELSLLIESTNKVFIDREMPVSSNHPLYSLGNIGERNDKEVKIKQKIINNELNTSKNNLNRSVSSFNHNNNSNNNNNRRLSRNEPNDRKECVACLLGAKTSTRGYSPMVFNPYKKYSSSKIKNKENNNNNKVINLNKFNVTTG